MHNFKLTNNEVDIILHEGDDIMGDYPYYKVAKFWALTTHLMRILELKEIIVRSKNLIEDADDV